MTDKEVMQMALDALNEVNTDSFHGKWVGYVTKEIEALRACLAQPESEPVAWKNGYKSGYAQAQETDLAMPRKEWVGLTNDEIDALHKKDRAWPLYSNIARDIEAKLKEKNT